MVENQSSQPNINNAIENVLNTKISRRGLLKAFAAGTLLATLPWSEALAASPAWDKNIALVDGEPALEGVIIPQNVGVLNTTANQRSENSARGGDNTVTGQYAANSFVEISQGKEDLTDLDNGETRHWVGERVVYDSAAGEVIQNPTEGYIAKDFVELVHDAAGNLRTDIQIPQPLIDSRYTKSGGLLYSDKSLDVAQTPGLLAGAGGTAELNMAMATGWGVEVTDPTQNPFEVEMTNPLRVWQKSAYIVATQALGDMQSITGKSYNITELFSSPDEQEAPFYLFAQAVENKVTIVTHLNNPGDEKNPHLFAITKFKKQDNNGTDLEVEGVAFASESQLKAGYADLADKIAQETTPLTGDVATLATDINKLSQTGIFLAGLDPDHQIAPKIKKLGGFNNVYYRANTDKTDYRVVTMKVGETKEAVAERTYLPSRESGGEWVQTATNEFMQQPLEQFNALGLGGERTRNNVFYATTYDQEGNPISIGHVDNVSANKGEFTGNAPLFRSKKNEAGKYEWIKVERADLAEIQGFKAGIYAQGWRAENDTIYAQAMIADGNHFLLDDAAMWKKLEAERGVHTEEMEKLKSAAIIAKNTGKTFSLGNGLLWGTKPEMLPDWLKDGQFTQEELLQAAEEHIESFLTPFKDMDNLTRVTVANEILPHLFELKNFFTDIKGIPVKTLLQRTYRKARDVVPNVELAVRDFSIGFAGYSRSDDMYNLVNELNEEEMELNNRKLIDVVEAQLPIGEPSYLIHQDSPLYSGNYTTPNARKEMMEKYKADNQRYKDMGVKMAGVEFFITPDYLPGDTMEEKLKNQANLYFDVYQASAENDIDLALYSPSNGGPFAYPDPATNTSPYPRDENENPLIAYAAINAALMSTMNAN